MCRNIHPLFNFDPPATPEEIRAAALQYVRKVSGFSKPSQVNAAAFDTAIEEMTGELLQKTERRPTVPRLGVPSGLEPKPQADAVKVTRVARVSFGSAQGTLPVTAGAG